MADNDILHAWLVPFYYGLRQTEAHRWKTLGQRRQWELLVAWVNDRTPAGVHRVLLAAMGDADEHGAAQEALEMLDRVWASSNLPLEPVR